MRVFLNYRREDSAARAGRLHDALVLQFGPKSVFQDVAAISAGEDFIRAIDRALDDCDAVLVVIGPRWLAPSADGEAPRLHEPDDYVRIEICQGFARDVKVVPVLVGGATLPTTAELPDVLGGLAQRQAVVLRDETWSRDVDGLCDHSRANPRFQCLAAGAVRNRRRSARHHRRIGSSRSTGAQCRGTQCRSCFAVVPGARWGWVGSLLRSRRRCDRLT